MTDWIDLSYLTGVTLAGAVARAIERGLPEGVRLRLNAKVDEDLATGWVWVHAVSVGELILADGIVRWLVEQGQRIHVTTGTPAGIGLLAQRLTLWNRDQELVTGGAFPLDDPTGLKPFLQRPPSAFIALETELWPNLLRELERRGIPRIIVNGRLTARSLTRGGPWLRRAASRISLVAARDPESLEHFQQLGAPWVELGGNLKADLPTPAPLHEGWQALREAWSAHPVLVAGNTVEGEEALVLDVWQQARESFPELRLILAPRQPRRFPEVGAAFGEAGLRFHRASNPWPDSTIYWKGMDVLLLDTLGELPLAYQEGTVALVGGGWTWHGGHNPLEPVRWGVPTLIGEGYANFQDLVNPLRDTGQVRVVQEGNLFPAVLECLQISKLRPGKSGTEVELPASLRGALGKTVKFLKIFMVNDR